MNGRTVGSVNSTVRHPGMTIDEINQLLLSWRIPSYSARYRIFQLKRKWWPLVGGIRVLRARQIAVLKAIRSLPWKVYLVNNDNPSDWEMDGPWIEATENTWVIPKKQSSDILLCGYLSPGCWGVYLSLEPYPSDILPSIFDAPVNEISSFLQSNSIPVMLEANHENAEWRIALEPAVVPMVNVA